MLLLGAPCSLHAECVLSSVWMRLVHGRHARARVLNGGWLVGDTLVEVGGRGRMFGYCTRFHLTASVCMVRLSTLYATECVFTVAYLRSARNTRAPETLFLRQVLSHGVPPVAGCDGRHR